ncbi:MAG: putative DNA-binding domain-containing protein [Methylophilaceae bacterium]
MSKTLKALELDFLDFLLTGNPSKLAPQVAAKGQSSIETKLNIYGNAYKMRFRETIDTNHELLGLYLGDELFEAMVDGYVVKHPSRYTSLRDYTGHLPEFLRNSAPFSAHPILAELASFERLLLDVFDALDAVSISIEDVKALPAESWPTMRLRLHPSVQMFAAEWNSVESWQALRAGVAPDAANHQPDSYWLLWRGLDRLSEFRSMTADEYALIQAIVHGSDFAHMCELLTQWHTEEEAPTVFINYLSHWVANGMIAAIVNE